MQQITVRADDDLVERVKHAAERSGQSMNGWVVTVLEAATNPEYAASRAEELRERLRRAGLLLEVEPRVVERPTPEELAAIAERLREGPLLSDTIVEDRG